MKLLRLEDIVAGELRTKLGVVMSQQTNELHRHRRERDRLSAIGSSNLEPEIPSIF